MEGLGIDYLPKGPYLRRGLTPQNNTSLHLLKGDVVLLLLLALPQEDAVLVLGSDGIFDVLSDAEAGEERSKGEVGRRSGEWETFFFWLCCFFCFCVFWFYRSVC